MFFHPKNLKSENNDPWSNTLLHTQSIVCATVYSWCLEYLGFITLVVGFCIIPIIKTWCCIWPRVKPGEPISCTKKPCCWYFHFWKNESKYKVRSIEKDTKVYAKYQVLKHSEIILFFYLYITLLSTLIWNARYCPTNNTIQANPYKSRGSGYPVDPSEKEQPLFGSTQVHQ